ncbi:MAG: peptidylprolyl isomerase [Candidatus Altiarchaeales archaeon]|nr:MAG: peptidylprolyl isomerase [Candidatus Altiarchaeales archaeon]RLI94395.1 MAG: peptidylprolyl isomerase [Candidatus Altiarchaeales archaeon]RLI94620.1 MAG: peptidylprolyl isomerase [Candidatus Altiarchaeales archaeon]
MPIKIGDKVKVEYVGTLDDGTVFDSTERHGEPLEFEVGAGQVLKGFEDAIIGMEKGEEKEIRLEPKDAYGEHKDELVQVIAKEQIPSIECPEIGMMLIVDLPSGLQLPAMITDVAEDTITIDFNHPLAGKALNFRIKILDVSS